MGENSAAYLLGPVEVAPLSGTDNTDKETISGIVVLEEVLTRGDRSLTPDRCRFCDNKHQCPKVDADGERPFGGCRDEFQMRTFDLNKIDEDILDEIEQTLARKQEQAA